MAKMKKWAKVLWIFLFSKEKPQEASGIELKFTDDLNAALLQSSPKKPRRVLHLIGLFMVTAMVWAAFAAIDEVTVGTGKVIPSQQIQIIQNLEGGIVKDILVSEGQVVIPGQELLTIDETRFLSDFREQASLRASLQAQSYRLGSELASMDIQPSQAGMISEITPQAIPFGELDPQQHGDLLKRQTALYDERIRNLNNQLAIFERQVAQKQQSLIEIDSKISHLNNSYRLVRKELDLTRPLASRGVVSEVELIKLERAANEVAGELESARLLKPKLKAELQEVENKLKEVVLNFRSKVQQELSEVEGELAGLSEVLVSLKDRLKRTTVQSPVKGTIKTIKINTVGGVIQPGMDLMEIVPIEDSLVVEAKVLPKDIAFLRPKLDAVIKLTAYDFAIYGGLKGTVEHISADTIQDEKDNSFYLIRVRTEASYYDKNNNPLPIIPGMTASVDVITGKKTVLDYLLKPIIRAKQNALREK